MRQAFREWLEQQAYKETTRNTQWTQAKRLETYYGDLDSLYDADQFSELRAQLEYTKADERHRKPNPAQFSIDGDLYQNLASYRATLGYYTRFREAEAQTRSAGMLLDRAALDKRRTVFLARYRDFAGFASSTGGYWEEERAYKETVIGRMASLLQAAGLDDAELGRRALDLLQKPPANFVGWRVFAQIKSAGPDGIATVSAALGEMLRDRDDVAAVAAECAGKIHPVLLALVNGNRSSAQVRSLVTTALALARPDEAIAVKTRYMQRAVKQLTGRELLNDEVVSEAEYRHVVSFAQGIFAVMRDEWRWSPKDLWDVQGFLWASKNEVLGNPAEPDDREELDDVQSGEEPTAMTVNRILYGPPGCGKTYETSVHAVALCDGRLPNGGRAAVMKRYRELIDLKRIEFVTFHQSYAYEDFVEGLRPQSSGSEIGKPALSLQPISGVFKRIARRAEAGRHSSTGKFDFAERRVFKMSIGEAANPEDEYLFEEAVESGYVLLGWGDKVDWSAPRFKDRDAMMEAWRPHQPADRPLTSLTGHIKYPFTLRNRVNIGDLIIVSKGNTLFRGIAEVLGSYEYAPRDTDNYANRRKVRWLWVDRRGVPVEEIYSRNFSMESLYELARSELRLPILERYIASGSSGGERVSESFVLIIDEINRANVSKVFGELITLIEPDKRLGAENELTVTLPYSGETFGIPDNLHVVATMNSADRSIALLDTALRRRFEFVEIMPEPALLREASASTGIDLVAVLAGLNARIEYLFDRDHQIGHGFFMKCGTAKDVSHVMRTKIIPLLAEYFYESWDKVRQVLGETTDAGAFVARTPIAVPGGADAYASDQERWRYTVLQDFPLTAYEQLKA